MNWLFVALGGAIGSVLRYKLSNVVLQQFADYKFPVSTFLINIVGCLVIGVLAGLTNKENFFSPEMKLFLFTGICGGFTTFSAFGLETFSLIMKEEYLVAFCYVVASVFVGISILALGFYITQQVK